MRRRWGGVVVVAVACSLLATSARAATPAAQLARDSELIHADSPVPLAQLEARAAEIMAFRDASVTPAGYLLAFEYLLATTQAEVSWLRSFADSTRSGGPQRRLTVSGNTMPSHDEVGI